MFPLIVERTMGNTRLSMNPKVSNPNQGIIFIPKKTITDFRERSKAPIVYKESSLKLVPNLKLSKSILGIQGVPPLPG